MQSISVDDGDAILMAQKLARSGLGVGIASDAKLDELHRRPLVRLNGELFFCE